jgi:hypothetical protein
MAKQLITRRDLNGFPCSPAPKLVGVPVVIPAGTLVNVGMVGRNHPDRVCFQVPQGQFEGLSVWGWLSSDVLES